MDRLAIITGGQRSGSTVLAETLESSGSALNCAEIFHPEGVAEGAVSSRLRLKPPFNYFRYVSEAGPNRTEKPCLSLDDQRELWSKYVQLVKAQAGSRVVLFNIKYNSWRVLDHVWQPLAERPHLLQVLADGGARFLHLQRRDLFAQVMSEVRAWHTGVWHVSKEGFRGVAPATVQPDPSQVLRRMRGIASEARALSAYLNGSGALEIYYEDLFAPDGGLQPAAAAEVAAFLNVEVGPEALQAPLKKLGDPSYSWLGNAEAFLAFFEKTEFDELVRAALKS